MFVKYTLLKYCLRRVLYRPVSLLVSVLLTAFCVYCFLGIYNFYASASQSVSENWLTIKPRAAGELGEDTFKIENLSPLLKRISQLATVQYIDSSKIKIITDSNKNIQSIAGSLRSALDSQNFKIETSSEYNQQTTEIVQSLMLNIFILVLMLGLVSSLIIAGNAEISITESKGDLHRLSLLGCSKKQLFFLIICQFLIQSLAGSFTGLLAYHLSGHYLSSYIVDSLSAIPGASTDIKIQSNFYISIISTVYGLFLTVLASIWAIYRHYNSALSIQNKSSYKLYITFALAVLFLFITYISDTDSKIAVTLMIADTLLVTALISIIFYKLIFTGYSESRSLELRLAAGYLKQNYRWIILPCISMAMSFSLLVSIITLLHSFDTTFKSWLSTTLNKDIFITAKPFNLAISERFIAKEDIDALTADSNHKNFSFLSTTVERFNSSSLIIYGSSESLENLSKIYAFKYADADKFSSGKGLLVNEIFANRFGKEDLDLLGEKRQIIAVYRDYGSQQPTIILPAQIFSELTGIKEISNMSFDLIDSSDSEEEISALKARLNEKYSVYSRGELVNEALSIFYKTFNLTRAVNVALIVLIISTSFLLVILSLLQHRRYLKLLRVLGFSLPSFTYYNIFFALLLLLPGLLLGSFTGFFMAELLVNRMNPVFFGWSLDYYIPYADYLFQTSIIMVAVTFSALIAYFSHLANIDSVEFSSE